VPERAASSSFLAAEWQNACLFCNNVSKFGNTDAVAVKEGKNYLASSITAQEYSVVSPRARKHKGEWAL
jgi:hypothetical protein